MQEVIRGCCCLALWNSWLEGYSWSWIRLLNLFSKTILMIIINPNDYITVLAKHRLFLPHFYSRLLQTLCWLEMTILFYSQAISAWSWANAVLTVSPILTLFPFSPGSSEREIIISGKFCLVFFSFFFFFLIITNPGSFETEHSPTLLLPQL